jgi:hypothetical protein
MAPGQPRINLQIPEVKVLSFVDRFRAGDRFASGAKNVRASFLAQARQVRQVVRMGMGKENQLHVQFVAAGKPHHFTAIGTRIEDRRGASCRIPDQIGVHGHIVKTRVELRETIALIDLFRTPFPLRQLAKRVRGKIQDRSDAQQRRFIKIAFE